jgi:hypothetical protein
MTGENYVRIPICGSCEVECPTCKHTVSIRNYADELISIKELKKKAKKDAKPEPTITPREIPLPPEVSLDIHEVLRTVDTSKIENLDFFRRSIKGVLDTVFSLDIGFLLGIQDVEDELAGKIPMDYSRLNISLTRLSHLLSVLLILRSAGLGTYEDEIIKAEISRLYQPRSPRGRQVDPEQFLLDIISRSTRREIAPPKEKEEKVTPRKPRRPERPEGTGE